MDGSEERRLKRALLKQIEKDSEVKAEPWFKALKELSHDFSKIVNSCEQGNTSVKRHTAMTRLRFFLNYTRIHIRTAAVATIV